MYIAKNLLKQEIKNEKGVIVKSDLNETLRTYETEKRIFDFLDEQAKEIIINDVSYTYDEITLKQSKAFVTEVSNERYYINGKLENYIIKIYTW